MLARGPSAWQSPHELAERLEMDPETLTDALAELDLAGWLTVWERPDGLVVTLSAWGASRLGLRLLETPGRLTFRWVDADADEPRIGRARPFEASDPDPLAGLLDPSPPPGWDAEENRPEGGGTRDSCRCRTSMLPCPSRFIGEGLVPWPGPGFSDGLRRDSGVPLPCPACRNRPLATREYCLRCDRWGFDDRNRPSPPRHPRRLVERDWPAGDPRKCQDNSETAAALRERRRERRRKRFARRTFGQ